MQADGDCLLKLVGSISYRIVYDWKAVKIPLLVMAVPKKKTSKSKRDKRKATWKHKATVAAQKALSLGKSILTGRSNFVYPTDDDDAEGEEV